MENKKVEVKKLPNVPNICNQRLKEVWKSKDASMAYVEMDPKNISLLHKHDFTEIYYILDGKGMMRVGDEIFSVGSDTLVEIQPGSLHKLENIGNAVLRHLVISIPPFDPQKTTLVNE